MPIKIFKSVISQKIIFKDAALIIQVIFGMIDDVISIDLITDNILFMFSILVLFFLISLTKFPKPKKLKYSLKYINNKKVKKNIKNLLMIFFNYLL